MILFIFPSNNKVTSFLHPQIFSAPKDENGGSSWAVLEKCLHKERQCVDSSIAWNLHSLGHWVRKRHPDLTAVKSVDLPLTGYVAFFNTDVWLPDNDFRRICGIWRSIHNCLRGRSCGRYQGRTEEKPAKYANSNAEAIIMMTAPMITMVISASSKCC